MLPLLGLIFLALTKVTAVLLVKVAVESKSHVQIIAK